MIDELIKDINELLEIKKQYEFQKADKQRMSDKLYELMMQIYKQQTYEERVELHKKEQCKDCRWFFDCKKELPENIWEPITSDRAWIPAIRICKEFEWS